MTEMAIEAEGLVKKYPVGSHAKMTIAYGADGSGGERTRERVGFHDEVVVAQPLPLGESHGMERSS